LEKKKKNSILKNFYPHNDYTMAQIPKILGDGCKSLYRSIKSSLEYSSESNNTINGNYNTNVGLLSTATSTNTSSSASFSYLLTGPNQSGKSSALEAVAHELVSTINYY